MFQASILSPGSVPRISYAPNHEDILLDRLFGDHVGTFLDVGPRHPITGNLTYFFYQRGWRGVNLEPVLERHLQFQAARPGDLNLPLAAWDSNGEIPVYEVSLGTGENHTTFSAALAEQYRGQGLATIERRVPVLTIRSLVEELRLDPPDFLLIGVARSGEPVIRGIALERWRPAIIVVSSIWPGTVLPAPHGWEPILLAQGYQFATFNGVNRFYLRDDLRDHRERLEVPVSLRDRFQRAEVVALQERVRTLEQESARWRTDAAHWRSQAEPRAEWERRLAEAEHQRDQWKHACEGLGRELIATQRDLRPYRLIDQLGVVTLGYRWARRFKPNRAS
jgi:FkbM family methyltransferase